MNDTDSSDREDRRARAPRRSGFLQRLRNNFLTGIVVVAPFAITLYLTLTIVAYIDDTILPQILPLIPERYHPKNLLPFNPLGLGVVVIVVALIFIGSLTKNFFGRELIKFTERSMERMPVVRSLYNGLKQIVETIFQQSQGSFERACLVEYPRRGLWAVAFVSTKSTGEIPKKALGAGGGEMMSVFLPTTPNPTSGFLLFVPREDVILLDMTVEEAAKLVISAGLVTPADLHEAAAARALTEAARSDAARTAIREEIARRSGGRARNEASSPAAAAEAAARNPFRSL